MDWNAAIERNREALKRVLASLVAMAGLNSRGQFTFFPQGSARPQDIAQAEKSKLSPAPTLPRHLHRAVLRLLRPAESAARRLVILAARDLVVTLPPARPRKPDPTAGHAALRALGIAVVMSPADHARAAVGKSRRPHPEARSEAEPRRALLPLFDPLPRLLSLSTGRLRRRTVPPHSAPRILSFDGARPHRLPPPPSPDDPIDARRLALRLQTVAAALDDLPGHARRFARWQSRRNRGLVRLSESPSPLKGGVRGGGSCSMPRVSPLRPGRPPGQRSARSRRPAHEVHDVLGDLQYFAFKALQPPDTS